MDRRKRRTSAPNLPLGGLKEMTRPTMTRRQSEGMVKRQTSLPVVPMPKYYMRSIDRETAERLLQSKPAGTFLVRDRQSSDTPGSYTLSLRDKNHQCRHFKIDTYQTNQRLVIYGYPNNQFDSLDKLVEFFVIKQKNELQMRPFGQEALYEEMNDDMSSYQTMEPAIPSIQKSGGTPSRLCQDDYENISRKGIVNNLSFTQPTYENTSCKGGSRRPPPPEPPGSVLSSPEDMLTTLPVYNKTPVYQNIPAKDETIPVPPRRPPSITGTRGDIRRGSLPIGYENILTGQPRSPPPPLPSRPHANSNYQNIPGKGSMGDGGNKQRPAMHRSLTEPNT